MNIKQMFILTLTLLVIYIMLSFIFIKKTYGHNVTYSINNNDINLQVKEIFTYRKKNEEDNYYFEITNGNKIFSFTLFDTFNKKEYIIKDIKYFENNSYSCIYPVFKDDEQLTDVLCLKDDIIYPYQTIKGMDDEVDNFVKKLNYNDNNYIEDKSSTLKKETITIYRNNLLNNHYIAIENYKGLYLINNNEVYKSISLFENDLYKKELSTFYSNIYLVADYNQKHTFNEFFLVDITNGKKSTIISNNSLNLDSYIMGTVLGETYIFDTSDKQEYSISYSSKKISTVGNENSGIKIYKNLNWETESSYKAVQEKITFTETNVNLTGYEEYQRIDKIGNENSGYYYFYKYVDGIYKAYRSSIINPNIKTYLFDTTDIDNIIYVSKYIYYRNNTDILYYSDTTGSKAVISNKEYEYNKSLKFGVYVS
jgi:hypothetical protein